VGWQNPRAKFVFHYYLQHPQENKLVVQRGRFEGWNRTSIQALLKRITGN
jgi:inner membrane protein